MPASIAFHSGMKSRRFLAVITVIVVIVVVVIVVIIDIVEALENILNETIIGSNSLDKI